MSNGINNISIFERLLQRFRFKEPLPDEAKLFILKYERNALTKTLKRFDEYNLVYGFGIRIFYLSYKLRLRFSMTQSKIILGIISILILIALSVTILFAASLINIDKSNVPEGKVGINFEKEKIEIKKPVIKESKPSKQQDKKIRNIEKVIIEKEVIKKEKKPIIQKPEKKIDSVAGALLGINRLIPNDVDEEIAYNATIKLYNKLRITRGDQVIFREKSGISIGVNRQLIGRVSKFGKGFAVSIKIVEGEKGSILFNKTVLINKEDDMDKALDDIAENINNKQEIWQGI